MQVGLAGDRTLGSGKSTCTDGRYAHRPFAEKWSFADWTRLVLRSVSHCAVRGAD
jgi:hypothetical protein